jgi:hypothetical protein
MGNQQPKMGQRNGGGGGGLTSPTTPIVSNGPLTRKTTVVRQNSKK